MSQSRLSSAAESALNVAIGLVVAVTAQAVIFPWFGIQVSAGAHLGIAACFTVVSIVRSYVLRRVFNRFAEKK